MQRHFHSFKYICYYFQHYETEMLGFLRKSMNKHNPAVNNPSVSCFKVTDEHIQLDWLIVNRIDNKKKSGADLA